MTREAYEQVRKALAAAGADRPAGRLHHSLLDDGKTLSIFDIWENEESFIAFGEIIRPILAEQVPDMPPEAGEPAMMQVLALEQSAA